jgi:hypothetical protein
VPSLAVRNYHSIAPGDIEDRSLGAGMLHVGGHDLVARLPVETHDGEIDPVRGVARERDLVRATTEQASDFLASPTLEVSGPLVALAGDAAMQEFSLRFSLHRFLDESG